MKNNYRAESSLVCVLGLVVGVLGTAASAQADTLGDALEETRATFNWRVRQESVDDASFAESADALTSRVRAGFETGAWGKTSLLGEIVWTEELSSSFNSTVNGKTQYPVVADPGGFVAVNRFALTNKSLEHTALTFGRQRVVLDDARFVGNVGWRQNEQTYDGMRAQLDYGKTGLDLAYITQVNRIFGPDSPIGEWNGDIVLLNLSHEVPGGKLTLFGYGLDIDEAPALSTDTVGLRFTGSKPFTRVAALYTVSFARQSDAGENPADFAETYYMLEGGIKIDKVTLALGYEQLGSDGTNRVTTPLATLHAFQGWADKFLNTPATGIDDAFVRVGYAPGKIGPFSTFSLNAVYHELDADVGGASYGDEVDLALVGRLQQLTLTAKYASYDADTLFADTDKFWFSIDYAF